MNELLDIKDKKISFDIQVDIHFDIHNIYTLTYSN
jgi:hypothetical protein